MTQTYTGKVVYMFAFDIAYEMQKTQFTTLLGQPIAQFDVNNTKRNPKHLLFFKPQTVTLPPKERYLNGLPIRIETSIKILPVGAISISVSVPFSVSKISELVNYHDIQFNNGNLNSEIRILAESVRQELKPQLIKPGTILEEEEAYTVFCLEPISNTQRTEDWLNENRREIAAVLTQEDDAELLSHQEALESTSKYLSYYTNDLVVIDWDAALIIQQPDQIHETLYILELANIQLAELEAYDKLLDTALDRAYRDITKQSRQNRKEVMRELREIRIDLTRFSDELSNITKFFGDWHLAKIFKTISNRFHLSDWHETIDKKLQTLDDLYQILKQDATNSNMMTLEIIIVLLFILDLIIIVYQK